MALNSLVLQVMDLDELGEVETAQFDAMPGGQMAAQFVAVHRGRQPFSF